MSKNEQLINLAMKQEMTFDEMIDLLPVFKGIEKECNNKELILTKIYLLGIAIGKQEKADPISMQEFVRLMTKTTPKQRKIINDLVDELLRIQKEKSMKITEAMEVLECE